MMKQTPNQKNEQLPVNPEAAWRLLGLATRARLAVAGTEATEQAVHRQKARLVIIAEDAADNTRQQFLRQCQLADVPYRQFGSKAELGHWTGHEARAVVAIIDQGFASRLMQLISTIET